MINSLNYQLIKQPNTISEEVFSPNEKLTKFIKENKSRILVIQASNSSGKSFLLNIIAYAFYALNLDKDELPDSLRRSINYLIDEGHQKIDYNISISDPDGFNIESSKDAITNKPIVIRKNNNIEKTEAAFGCGLELLDKQGLIKKYEKEINKKKISIWVLESSLQSLTQEIQCSMNVAINVSNVINQSLGLIDGNNENKSDPSNLGEADIIGLLTIIELMANRLKEIEKNEGAGDE